MITDMSLEFLFVCFFNCYNKLLVKKKKKKWKGAKNACADNRYKWKNAFFLKPSFYFLVLAYLQLLNHAK